MNDLSAAIMRMAGMHTARECRCYRHVVSNSTCEVPHTYADIGVSCTILTAQRVYCSSFIQRSTNIPNTLQRTSADFWFLSVSLSRIRDRRSFTLISSTAFAEAGYPRILHLHDSVRLSPTTSCPLRRYSIDGVPF